MCVCVCVCMCVCVCVCVCVYVCVCVTFWKAVQLVHMLDSICFLDDLHSIDSQLSGVF